MTAIALSLPGLDLRQRRDAVFDMHSALRSADNLRPDEAFDELVKLYTVWLRAGLAGFDEAREVEPELRLSRGAFQRATELLGPLLVEGRRDTGADLFQELVDVGVRAGLGQYFTPTPVARAMAAFLKPATDEAWIDPFCGSGLLMGEIAAAAGKSGIRLYGIDRDPRVLRLAALEADLHHPDVPMILHHGNAFSRLDELFDALGATPPGFDGLVTNPPFGAEVHRDDQACYDTFELAGRDATSLEILGLERSVQLLRPGGRLGIVLPQSVISNRGLRHVRQCLTRTCHVDAVLSLPPETFGPFRGVGKAAVVFATKKPTQFSQRGTAVAVAGEIGWDSTGRQTATETVTATARKLADGACEVVQDPGDLERNMSPEWHLRPRAVGRSLKDLASTIFTGRSPGRAAYLAADGANRALTYRVLKVGDLTGSGVDWSLGERSVAAFPRPVASKLLEVGDIALTAAAHHPRYIGAKVDVIDVLPPDFGDRVMPCAEVLVIRPKPDEVDPHVLLLWLRSPKGHAAVQACVTGQTAHLYPEDLGEIVVPETVLSDACEAAVAKLRESLALRRRAEEAAFEARRMFAMDSECPL